MSLFGRAFGRIFGRYFGETGEAVVITALPIRSVRAELRSAGADVAPRYAAASVAMRARDKASATAGHATVTTRVATVNVSVTAR